MGPTLEAVKKIWSEITWEDNAPPAYEEMFSCASEVEFWYNQCLGGIAETSVQAVLHIHFLRPKSIYDIWHCKPES